MANLLALADPGAADPSVQRHLPLQPAAPEPQHLANITLDDDGHGNVDGRGSLSERQELLGLSDEEVQRIRGATGHLVCAGVGNGDARGISAFLVGTNMQVATALHGLLRRDGTAREPFAECVFRNQAMPPVEVRLDPGADGHRFGASGPFRPAGPQDWAVVRLQEPVVGAVPFPTSPEALPAGSWAIAIAAHQAPTSERAFDLSEPVAQRCRVRRQVSDHALPSRYHTDCDLVTGGSGGVLLSRDASDGLAAGAVAIASGRKAFDYLPFNDGPWGYPGYSVHLALDGPFLEAVDDIAATLPPDVPGLAVAPGVQDPPRGPVSEPDPDNELAPPSAELPSP